MTYSLNDNVTNAVLCVTNGLIPLVLGNVGIGKTQVVVSRCAEALEKLYKVKPYIINFPCAVIERQDIQINALKNGVLTSHVTDALPKNGGDPDVPTLLVFDEIDKADPSIFPVVSSLITERKLFGSDYALQDNVHFVFLGNRTSDGTLGRRLPKNIINRLSVTEATFGDIDKRNWKDWAFSEGLAPEVIAFLNYFPHHFTSDESDHLGKQPTPRSWEKIGRLFPKLTKENLRLFVCSLVGEGIAREFAGFVKLAKKLPDFEAIFQSPKSCDAISEVQVLCLASASLVSRCETEEQVEASITFLSETCGTREFTNSFIRDLLTKKPELEQTAVITKFRTENANFVS
jgi:hypothetical protein